MNTDNDIQTDNLAQEVQELRERIAYIEGRREGSTRILGYVIPIAVAILTILSFATLSSRINAVVDQQLANIMEEHVRTRIESDEFKGLMSGEIEELVEEARVAAQEAKAAVSEAEGAVEEAEIAANDSKASATLTANNADMAEEHADVAEEAADLAEEQAEEVAVNATEVQSVLATPTITAEAP